MRQRNDTPNELHAWVDPFLVIAPGEEVEWEHPLTGCTVLEESPPVKEEKPAKKADVPDKTAEEPTP
jgi:hypothetical protein